MSNRQISQLVNKYLLSVSCMGTAVICFLLRRTTVRVLHRLAGRVVQTQFFEATLRETYGALRMKAITFENKCQHSYVRACAPHALFGSADADRGPTKMRLRASLDCDDCRRRLKYMPGVFLVPKLIISLGLR